ncbi:MAG TPA: CoA transferase, partial [Dehalococcoidia bacterium]|nr:CoA transferase [Dehalococcoidia bacterium]
MTDETRPLAGLRAIDLTSELGALAGKLLADLGADVIKVEPPGGDPARRLGPFADGQPDPERSLTFWHDNAGKKSVVLDVETDQGRAALFDLARGADLFLESCRPGWLATRGIGPADLRAANPALVVASISPFGQTGPYRDHRATEIVGWALGGYMSRCGDPDRPPLMGGVNPARQVAGLTGAIGSLAAVLRARRTGRGCHLDLSQQEAIASLGEAVTMMYVHEKQLYRRNGSDYPLVVPMIILPAADGYVHTVSVTVGQWDQLTTMLAIDDAVEDLLEERWADNIARRAHRDHVIGVVARWLATRPKQETMIRAQEEFRLPFAVTATTEDAANDPQLAALDFWVEVDQPAIGRRVRQAGPAPIFKGRRRPELRPAPRLGEHQR